MKNTSRFGMANVQPITKPDRFDVGDRVVWSHNPHRWVIAEFLDAEAYGEHLRSESGLSDRQWIEHEANYDSPLSPAGETYAVLERYPSRDSGSIEQVIANVRDLGLLPVQQ